MMASARLQHHVQRDRPPVPVLSKAALRGRRMRQRALGSVRELRVAPALSAATGKGETYTRRQVRGVAPAPAEDLRAWRQVLRRIGFGDESLQLLAAEAAEHHAAVIRMPDPSNLQGALLELADVAEASGRLSSKVIAHQADGVKTTDELLAEITCLEQVITESVEALAAAHKELEGEEL